MNAELVIDSCISVRGDCPVRATIVDEQIEVEIDSRHQGCCLAFEPAALRELVRVAGEALAELDVLNATLVDLD